MHCKRCARYDAMGFGQACPCTHVNGKCITPQGDQMATVPNNAQLIAQYNRAINALQTKLSRQQNAAIDTSAQIDAFRALVAQLEGKK